MFLIALVMFLDWKSPKNLWNLRRPFFAYFTKHRLSKVQEQFLQESGLFEKCALHCAYPGVGDGQSLSYIPLSAQIQQGVPGYAKHSILAAIEHTDNIVS